MPFALIARDKPDALDLRMANRAAHLAYVEETGVVMFGGPLLSDQGDMRGSLVVLDLPDRAAAEAWAAGDPYARAGLFEDVEISAWKKVVG
ncbi:YciI family protein [Pseudooceanicola sediminis]|uniref:YciI family protein n=1 Tax=Pseudooceanicola sediminis TaxID=2211117 RepID=A0A399J6Z1_9RHOB|nr:YciI family protein [Pseudooceanicola sediminis]KAA2315477.1 YciI family protein [Puniceibacterium sp. HSS470]RII40317.1 YciI family protein [Pseudooceanicola sediminis]|tara:strand:+ start:8578 stop:8850 length:273 start_codon:yes stop_codon:yes gene_type:complete